MPLTIHHRMALPVPEVTRRVSEPPGRTATGIKYHYRWVCDFAFWALGFKQSGLRHITRVPQHTVPVLGHDCWFPGMLQSYSTFRSQVSHQTHRPPSESVPVPRGIPLCASWRTETSLFRKWYRTNGRKSGITQGTAWSRPRKPAKT